MGGGGSAPQRSPGSEWPSVKQWEQGQTFQLNQFIQNQPLLKAAQQMGLDVGGAVEKYIVPILQGGGALTPQQERDVSQATRATEGAAGMLHTNAAIGTELLNRQGAQEQRFNTALGQTGSALSQMEGVETTAVNSFAAIADPVLQYLGNLFSGNLQAQSAQQTANTNKTAGIESAAISSIGEVAGAAVKASDIRLKEKIRDIGEETPEGIPIKTFQYKHDPSKQRFIGVLAQDVKKKVPEAIVKLKDGMMAVDFSKLKTMMLPIGAHA